MDLLYVAHFLAVWGLYQRFSLQGFFLLLFILELLFSNTNVAHHEASETVDALFTQLHPVVNNLNHITIIIIKMQVGCNAFITLLADHKKHKRMCTR